MNDINLDDIEARGWCYSGEPEALVAEIRRLLRLLDLATRGALGQYALGYNDAIRAAAGLDVADRALPGLK